MIVSRLFPVTRRSLGSVKSLMERNAHQKRWISTTLPKQGGHDWYYREMPPKNMFFERWAELSGAFMWWWIFWHWMTDYHHVIGHWYPPDGGVWTDEELGVPPDEADDPE